MLYIARGIKRHQEMFLQNYVVVRSELHRPLLLWLATKWQRALCSKNITFFNYCLETYILRKENFFR